MLSVCSDMFITSVLVTRLKLWEFVWLQMVRANIVAFRGLGAITHYTTIVAYVHLRVRGTTFSYTNNITNSTSTLYVSDMWTRYDITLTSLLGVNTLLITCHI